MKRAILPILVIAMLLIVPAIPGMITEEKQSNEKEVVNIIYGKDDVGLDHSQVTVEKAEVDVFTNNVQEFKTWLQETRPFMDLELTEEEKLAKQKAIQEL